MDEKAQRQYRNKLNQLGLCGKVGINNQIMLYPKKAKERKWHKQEYKEMVKRLYKVEEPDRFTNVNKL